MWKGGVGVEGRCDRGRRDPRKVLATEGAAAPVALLGDRPGRYPVAQSFSGIIVEGIYTCRYVASRAPDLGIIMLIKFLSHRSYLEPYSLRLCSLLENQRAFVLQKKSVKSSKHLQTSSAVALNLPSGTVWQKHESPPTSASHGAPSRAPAPPFRAFLP